MVRSFGFTAQTMQDNADPRITTSILLQTDPVSLTLGSRLFSATHGDAVEQLRGALLAKDVRDFSFGFHHASNVFGRLYDFLIAWTSLRSLSLTYFDLQLTYPGLVSPIPPPPTYELTQLSLIEVYIKPLPPLSLSWFLGATTTSLRSLKLHDVTFNDCPSEVFPLLPSHLATLAHLSLHNLSWIIPRGDPVPAYYPCRADTILPLCTALRSLSLQDAYYDRVLDHTVADLALPPTLTDLEMVGKRLFCKVGLEHVVETLPARSPLARVVLVGPTANQTGVPEVVLACQRKGLSIRTRFAP